MSCYESSCHGMPLTSPCKSKRLVCFMPYLLKLVQLKLPMDSSGINVHVERFDDPMCFVLQFNGKMSWFPIDEPKWGHSNWCFVGRTICPQCIIQTQVPILPVWPNGLLQDLLDFSIGHLGLAIGLGMVRC